MAKYMNLLQEIPAKDYYYGDIEQFKDLTLEFCSSREIGQNYKRHFAAAQKY